MQTAERVTDSERHVAEIALVHEVEIEIGEIVDGVEAARHLRAAKARMDRHDHPRSRRKQIEHACIGLDADLGMQEKQRPALSAIEAINADAAEADCMSHGLIQASSASKTPVSSLCAR